MIVEANPRFNGMSLGEEACGAQRLFKVRLLGSVAPAVFLSVKVAGEESALQVSWIVDA